MNDIKYTGRFDLAPLIEKDGDHTIAIRVANHNDVTIHYKHGINYISGPIADKLYAYEALGYSPAELEPIVEKHRRDMAWRLAINSTYGVTIPKESIERYVDTDTKLKAKAMNDYLLHDTAITKWVFDQVKVFQDRIAKTQVRVDSESYMKIKKVIFSDPATIVFWADGSKTVVKATNEAYDPEKGLAMAISKRALGNKHDYYDVFKKHLKKYNKEEKQ